MMRVTVEFAYDNFTFVAIRNFIKKLELDWHHFALNAAPSLDFLLWHLFDRDF